MANVKRISPLEAKELLDQGYTYVDVRTAEEFRAGHPTGAWNVPIAAATPGGSAPNPDFLPVLERLLSRDGKIVVGCATGVRSLRAAEILARAGFTEVVEQRAGFNGARNAFGGLAEPGWQGAGLPISRGDDEGSYAAIVARSSG